MPEHRKSSTLDRLPTMLTGRVLLLALLLIPLNAWWIIEIEYIRYSDNATTQAIFFNSLSVLLLLIGFNGLVRRFWPKRQFSAPELAAVYILVTLASNLAGHDQLQILFTTLTYVFRHDTPETGWGSKIIPHLAPHLTVRDKEAIDALYIGNSTLYRWEHFRPWLEPLGWWTLFTLLLVWTMLCFTALFRRQWDAERLSYPIAEIPIQLITQRETLFRSPLFWGGCAVGAASQILNLLHSLFPSIPSPQLGVEYYRFETYPWNSAGPLPICSYPFAYGLAFLLPTQLGFSCWFFFLMSRVQLVGAAMQGYTEWGRFPYIQQQGVGACIGLCLTIVWAARNHILTLWRMALNPQSVPESERPSSDELLSPRGIILGLVGGIAGLVGFAVAAGMRLQTALWFMLLLFIVVVVVARLRAELGLPTFELYQVGAEQVMQRTVGTSAWTQNDLAVMSFFFWLTRTHRQFPMQNQVDAARLGRRVGASLPSTTLVILGASALGIVCAFWALLHSTYQIGYDSAKFAGPAIWAFGKEPWQKMDSWVSSPQRSDLGSVGAYVFGALFTLFLSGMRARFLGWPFHPAGYLVAGSFGLFRLWLPIFVSWLLKALVLRYGGLRAYRIALPFFLGLVVGEFTAGFVRTILDLTLGLHLPPSSGIGGL